MYVNNIVLGLVGVTRHQSRVVATASLTTALLFLSRTTQTSGGAPGDTPTTTLQADTCSTDSCRTYSSSQTESMSSPLERAKAESLWGLCVGDSLAMPAHWYYNPSDIKRGYGGWLTGYNPPNKRHPSSILTLSAVDGSGRSGWGAKSKPVIGNLILHDKLKYWASGDRSTHYHQGMKAGDSTLNALTALETIKVMQRVDPDATLDLKSLQAAVMENYVTFMTTPGSHNDTYAESFHRLFFQDWSRMENPPKDGPSLVQMAENRYRQVTPSNEDHQIPVIGALVLTVPWILHYAHKSADECAAATVSALRLTHPAPSLEAYVEIYARLLHAVLNGGDLGQEALKALENKALGGAKKRKIVHKFAEEAAKYSGDSRLAVYQEATGRLGSACYIEGAMTSMLLLAHGFSKDFTAGVLTNANCGGENAHRGAALGALLGASAANQGPGVPDRLKDGLNSGKQAIQQAVISKI